jgi:hypothetical protein
VRRASWRHRVGGIQKEGDTGFEIEMPILECQNGVLHPASSLRPGLTRRFHSDAELPPSLWPKLTTEAGGHQVSRSPRGTASESPLFEEGHPDAEDHGEEDED